MTWEVWLDVFNSYDGFIHLRMSFNDCNHTLHFRKLRTTVDKDQEKRKEENNTWFHSTTFMQNV